MAWHQMVCTKVVTITLVMVTARRCCRSDTGKIWYAQLLLLFSYETADGGDVDAAHIRWLKPTVRPSHASGFKLQPLKWEVHKRRVRPARPRTDVTGLNQILGPGFI